MARISCLTALLCGKTKRSKHTKKVSYGAKRVNGNECPKVKPVEFMEAADIPCIGKCSGNAPARDTKVVLDEAAAESALDEDDAMARGLSNVELVRGTDSSGRSSDAAYRDTMRASPDVGVYSAGRTAPTGLSRLKRSCSNIETARLGSRALDLLPAKSRSHDDLVVALSSRSLTSPNVAPDTIPAASLKTTFSADPVMLKRRSSSQVLPSWSRKVWWRLFLWSHRNLHREGAAIPVSPPADTDDMPLQRDGYTSDTHDEVPAAADAKNKEIAVEEAEPIPNQCVAFTAEASSLDRVSAWVSTLGDGLFHLEENKITEHHDGAVCLHRAEIGESSASASASKARRRTAADEAIQASSIVQTLNAFSSVAHISGMGLKVVPTISAFSSLHAVNLSGNLIAHISPGSLPKGLHSLDLSRNKIATIEGLRELARLRVLNLSYNRITRIGRGLSSCTAIRELYLAGNKISDVEGLHRLLKLAVLDLSFNKITTAKDLGQLVANYSSLRALNLLGNQVQTNVGDDPLRKAVSSLLPWLEYLNKQVVKPRRAREAASDSVAKAALGNGGWSSRRRLSRRLSQNPGLSTNQSRGGRSSSHRGTRSRSRQ